MEKLKPGYRFLSYRLEKCIGKGAFGAVWSAQQEGSGQMVAIKFEYPTVSKSLLPEEAAITRTCCSSEYFPRFLGSGNQQGFAYMVMENLGMSVRQFQENHTSGILSLNEVGSLGIAMIKAIRAFHDLGFVHRDIKPSNFVFRGRPDQLQVCLIDFGLAKRWKSPEGEVYPARANVGFRGTARYASVNSHEGADLGRRDDLWSLFYVLIELGAPPLPWKSQSNKEAVAQIKMRSVNRLCTGLPFQFQEIADHLSSLNFADEPDYDMLIQKLNAVVEGAEGGTDFGVCLSEQYGSMALIVAPNSGSVIGSASAVEGSWSEGPVIAPQAAKADEPSGGGDEVKAGKGDGGGGCCLLL